MGFIYEWKKKALQKQRIVAEKTRMKREKYIRKELELKKLKDKVSEAKRLKLSPSEQAFNRARIQKKAMEAKRRKEQWIKTRDHFARTAKTVARDITWVAEKLTKEEPKPRRKRRLRPKRRKRRTRPKRR